jgi:hypothetical protein
MALSDQVNRRGPCATAIVDAHRDQSLARMHVHADHGPPPVEGAGDHGIVRRQRVENDPVHGCDVERGRNARSSVPPVRYGGQEEQPRLRVPTRGGDPADEGSGHRVGEQVGRGRGVVERDGPGVARPEQAPLRAGATMAQGLGAGEVPEPPRLRQLVGTVERVRDGRDGYAEGAGHVDQPRPAGRIGQGGRLPLVL